MVGEAIRFNCGEYRPGLQPIGTPGIFPPSPPTVIPIASGTPVPPFISTPPPTDRPPIRVPPVPGDQGHPQEIRYRCQEFTEFCPPPNQDRIKQIHKSCIQCTPRNDGSFAPECTYRTLADCTITCVDGPLHSCGPITPSVSVSSTNNTVSVPPITNVIVNSTANTNTVSVNINNNTNTNTTISVAPPVNINNGVSISTEVSNQVYHPYYNFFQASASTTTLLVPNNRHLDIFDSSIPNEILFFINNNGTANPWNETPLNDLSTDKIGLGLNKDLLKAFNSIHFFGGMKVDISYFLQMVKRLLVTNALDEMDASFYINLGKAHSSQPFIKYTGTENKTNAQKAALGIISTTAKSPDYTKQSDLGYQQLKRQKRLATDVNAAVNILSVIVSTVASYDIVSTNPGIEVTYISGTSSVADIVPLGKGAGYYLGVTSVINDSVPLELTNDLSGSYYPTADIRHNTLNLLGVDPTLTFTVSSLSGINEFDGNFDYSSVIQPLYFKLELSSVDDGDRVAPLTDSIVANYVLLASGDVAEHADTYGYSVTKLNVDYRDPFLMYARDTSVISLEQHDITFRAFDTNKAGMNNSILTRTLPFALVLTPGVGSVHNPFGVRSQVISIDSNYIVRSMDCVPHIALTTNPVGMQALEETNLYNSNNQYSVGLLEPADGQAVTFRLNLSSTAYTKAFYINGNYTSAHPGDATMGGISNIITGIVDYLTSSYNPEILTWWDILSRATLSELGSFVYDNNSTLQNFLVAGGRDVPIRDVLNRATNAYTGITQTLNSDDTPILTITNRANVRNY